jgi:hypothetical protein
MTPVCPRQIRLSACPAVSRGRAETGRGVRGRTHLQAADGDDFLSRPDLQLEGAAAAVEDGVGAVVQWLERRHGAAVADPD